MLSVFGGATGGWYLDTHNADATHTSVAFGVGPSGPATVQATTAAGTLPLDTWAHVVGRFDNAGGQGQIFVNGQASGAAASQGGFGTAPGAFSLSQSVGGYAWDGQLDECFVTARVLTAAEICRVCSCGVNGTLCTCDAATPPSYLTTGRNAGTCGACALPACNAPPPGPATVPQATWQLWQFDSEDEELVAGYAAAPAAFDGDPLTFWRSRGQPAPTILPHELSINLGGLYQLTGLRYLPRQDGVSEGRIGQYEFYVSSDGATWGSPVANGTFANSGAEQEVQFPVTTGQFVRLRALSEVAGGEATAVAELTMLGTCVAPSVRIAPPQTLALQPDATLVVTTTPCLDPGLQAGWGVRIAVDGGPAVDRYTAPFSASFGPLALAEHTATSTLLDDAGVPVPGTTTQDQVSPIGIGDTYVAVGDSITDGYRDDLPADDSSQDGRVTGSGYPPILNDHLTQIAGYPQGVVRYAVGGTRAAFGASVLPGLLARYPLAQHFLILFGTNDSNLFLPVPSGLGLNPGDAGYPGTFKANLQQMLDTLNAAGKTAVLGKVPVALAGCGGCPVYADPDQGQRNVQFIKPYNQVIDELVANPANNLTITPPDFYAYFLQTYPTEYGDDIHPNGLGYQSIARLWCQTLTLNACP
jgi:lysophospholipase L1-like esterase